MRDGNVLVKVIVAAGMLSKKITKYGKVQLPMSRIFTVCGVKTKKDMQLVRGVLDALFVRKTVRIYETLRTSEWTLRSHTSKLLEKQIFNVIVSDTGKMFQKAFWEITVNPIRDAEGNIMKNECHAVYHAVSEMKFDVTPEHEEEMWNALQADALEVKLQTKAEIERSKAAKQHRAEQKAAQTTKIRELLQTGGSDSHIAEQVGCTAAAVKKVRNEGKTRAELMREERANRKESKA